VDRYQYLLLMAACLVITLPLEFVFGARVWRRPRRLLALVPTVLVFAIWDIFAVAREHWSFSASYTIAPRSRRTRSSLPSGKLARYIGSSGRSVT
jgi:lycopene cyclase domain-containing protein